MGRKIVCKYQCYEVAKQENAELVKLRAVSGDANKPWSKWTPQGNFDALITNPDAMGAFEPGKQYLLEIAEAPAE